MSLSIGLVGLPNAGKSTLFNALTQRNVLVADYPFATIKPNLGVMPLIDERLEQLAEKFKSSRIVFANVNFVDIAGLVKNAHLGEGLGNQFLSHIRQSQAIALVTGCFGEEVDYNNNLSIIQTELLLADWQTLDNQKQKLTKIARHDDEAAQTLKIIQKALTDIDEGLLLNLSPHQQEYYQTLTYLNLLTLKSFIYVFNLADKDLKNQSLKDKLIKLVGRSPCLFLSAQLENELSRLTSQERKLFLDEYNLPRSGVDDLAHLGIKILSLQTFLTAGPKEVRAWLITKNCLAPKAAKTIHEDMQKGFIAAEIISFSDLKNYPSWSAAKAAGLCRVEGKNYRLQPDDVVNFKFNV